MMAWPFFSSFGQSFRQWNKRVLMSDHETNSTIINELNRAKKNKCCREFRQTNKQTKMVSKECVSLEHSTWRLPNESWKCLCCRPRDWHRYRILWSCNHSVQISLSTVCAISLKFYRAFLFGSNDDRCPRIIKSALRSNSISCRCLRTRMTWDIVILKSFAVLEKPLV